MAAAAAATALFIGMWGLITAIGQSAARGLGAHAEFTQPSFSSPALLAATSLALLAGGELVVYASGSGRLREIPGSAFRRFRRIAVKLTRALGLTRLTRRGLLLAAATTLLAFLTNLGITSLVNVPANPEDPRYLATANLNPLEQGAVFAMMGAPEELLFRGPILITAALTAGMASRGWRTATIGAVLIASSAIFGAVHPSLDNILSATAHGLIWGGLALLTRSIWPSFISHAAHNLVVGLVT